MGKSKKSKIGNKPQIQKKVPHHQVVLFYKKNLHLMLFCYLSCLLIKSRKKLHTDSFYSEIQNF